MKFNKKEGNTLSDLILKRIQNEFLGSLNHQFYGDTIHVPVLKKPLFKRLKENISLKIWYFRHWIGEKISGGLENPYTEVHEYYE